MGASVLCAGLDVLGCVENKVGQARWSSRQYILQGKHIYDTLARSDPATNCI